VPSAEEAIETQLFDDGAPFWTQVIPESDEEYIGAPTRPVTDIAAATSFVPSADEATAPQVTLLNVVVVHDAPEFVETYTALGPGEIGRDAVSTATSVVPSADDAIALHE